MKKFMVTSILISLCVVLGVGFTSRPKSVQLSENGETIVPDQARREHTGKKKNRQVRRCRCCNQRLPKNRKLDGQLQRKQARKNGKQDHKEMGL